MTVLRCVSIGEHGGHRDIFIVNVGAISREVRRDLDRRALLSDLRLHRDLGPVLARYEWRYLPRSTVSHALEEAGVATAECGLSANALRWMGTGTQDEYEKVASMPRCAKCVAVIRGGSS